MSEFQITVVFNTPNEKYMSFVVGAVEKDGIIEALGKGQGVITTNSDDGTQHLILPGQVLYTKITPVTH